MQPHAVARPDNSYVGHASHETPLLMRLREGPETIAAPRGQLQIALRNQGICGDALRWRLLSRGS